MAVIQFVIVLSCSQRAENETGNCGDKQYQKGKGFRGVASVTYIYGAVVSKDRVVG